MDDTKIRVGTSAFTAEGWVGSFYPPDMNPRDFLSYYATKFDIVEVDSTYYAIPAKSTVQGWYDKTPPGFQFALKVPSLITHEKMLVDCREDMDYFIETVDLLGEKLGPLLLQFPYFNKAKFQSGKEFLSILKPFLSCLPKDHKFALEIRNKWWLSKDFFNILRDHNVAFALIDQSWMPRPWEMKPDLNVITSDFLYVRWLGDRKGIEAVTKVWDKTIIDKTADLEKWVEVLKKLASGQMKMKTFAFANNHFAGHGPATVEQFKLLWNR
jgi:uncharacterized protein YecE (DUF72 family)